MFVFRGLSNSRVYAFLAKPTINSTSTHLRVFSSASMATKLKRIGTHNGSFHCDEALGCFMIRLTDKFRGAEVVRTRDAKVLETLDVVLDVGGVYDPASDRYDHHQKGFDEVLGHGFATKLSSAGLIYKHYGLGIIAKELQLEEGHPNVKQVYRAVYKNFMEAVDAIDNGINQYDTDQPPGYVNNTGLSSRVGRLNQDWSDPDQSAEKENEAFQGAMTLAGKEFLESVKYHARSWLPARSIVKGCLEARGDIDSSGQVMLLARYCPWKLHIFELEEEMQINPSIKYVIYQDDRSRNWRIQAVAVSPDKFDSRKPLPLSWRGLSDEELSDASGISGCIFVHMSGFIGANQSYEGALAMARTSLLTAHD
uniref:Metal-dependent protein hydrolase n=1 Tax=Kalanchoe fedtschenkoi TaxID=63787 RepID=A0A7N0U5P1_KALFE